MAGLRQTFITLISCALCGLAFAGHPTSDGITEMDHGTIEVPSNTASPKIGLGLFKDEMSGYNLQITVKAFVITPPIVSQMSEPSSLIAQGHAHLFINGVKIQRVYGEYVHLPSALFDEGINTITVSLNDHNHATWTSKGVEIQSTLTIDRRKKPVLLHQYSSSAL